MIEDIRKKMREIPGMDILLAQDWALPWIGELGRETVKRVRNYKDALRNMEMYIEMAPNGERISVAHFFVGEIYRNTKKYHKADIAY